MMAADILAFNEAPLSSPICCYAVFLLTVQLSGFGDYKFEVLDTEKVSFVDPHHDRTSSSLNAR